MSTNTDKQVKPLTLDDLVVGQKFHSPPYTVSADEIKSFARQYDPQPFHVDEEAAKDTFFEGLAASGWHTAAITMRLLVSSTNMAGGFIGGGGEITWPKATRPGDTLTVETEVMEIRPSRSRPERGMVSVRSVTRNQNGEAVQILVSKLVVPRRQT